MAEEKKKSYRLFKVAQELGVGVSSLVDYLNGNGHKVSNTPNEKLSEEQYELLLRQFASDAVQKQRAEQLRQISREAQQAHHKAEAEVPTPVVETPAPPAVAPAPPVPELSARPQLKVVGKIDLDAKKAAPQKREVPAAEVVAPAPEPPMPVAEVPVAPPLALEQPTAESEPEPQAVSVDEPETHIAPEAEPANEPVVVAEVPQPEAENDTPAEAAPETVIRASDNTPKLEGLKVVGKVNLNTLAPSGRTRPGTAEEEATRRKRKRKSTTLPTSPQPNTRTGRERTGTGTERRTDGVVSSSSIGSGSPQDNLRNTLAGMHRGPNRSRQKIRRDKRDVKAARREAEEQLRQADMNVLEVTEFLTANELANLMDVNVSQIIAKCLELGLFVSINQRIDADVIQLLAEEFGYEVRFLSPDETFAEPEDDDDDPEELEPRSPIVTVMGHVDHGKTSLLDYVRKANVIAGEAGGITQHIGAYAVQLTDGRHITFLDTPGHEAFTAMRARGAQLTDVAIIVIAADDQVMPQTREAINHAQAAGVPMVFAINKIDKEGAQPEKIKEQLAQMNLLVEDWGGKIGCELISAKSGQGIEDLLERVLMEAEALDLKANPNRLARGTVVEAQLDKGRGVVSTVLIQNGTLSVGDVVVANNHWGRIKAMTDERGNRVKEATPGMPVQILGLDGVPQAGDKFVVMEDERAARELATKRQQLIREQTLRSQKRVTLEEVARRAAQGDFQELNIIVKGDVDGSVEALADSLLKLSTPEVVVVIVHKAVGQITESDVLLASASNALVIGFQVRPSPTARRLAQTEKIDIRLYSVIYDAIDEIRDAMEGLLKPTVEEEVQAAAEVREVFRISKVGAVAGCMVIDGKINRGHPARLIRDGVVVHTGKILALKRFKDDVKEVAQGFECGISLENFNDIKSGDIIETFTEVEVKRTLAQTVTS